MTEPVAGVWLPKRAQVGTQVKASTTVGIIGPSGAGKSHLARQLALDPEYADQILVLASEDSTATYGADAMAHMAIAQVTTLDDAMSVVKELIAARVKGERMPKAVVVDSMSGIADYMTVYYKDHASEFLDDKGKKNTYAKFDDLAVGFTELFIKIRDGMKADCVVLATTTPPPIPQLCIAGRVVPANFNRWTSCCFFLNVEKVEYDPAAQTPSEKPYRTIARDELGKPLGIILNRYITTMNSGEILAKGHRNLGFRELAVLPDLLRKIHGRVG